ncbi:NAD(P)H-hydrate dehydratase [Acidaminobacter sp. JC074]|uniref:NAD(P)H-hydrate dehydratase n=1 Tax=Acidaminobacter sp. JC074 TaxID=2530199 RepID=UPI001F10D9FA|nr:NAD(P)H-hydrate dehydratase [Acidaminobacter sp. JC074]MCH4889549.1 NAD(P)H-hydrate dehydratase [Acidaminobacter sp. JC074]
MVILQSHEMKSLEEYAMKKYEIPGLILMEHAGSAVVDCILEEKPKKCLIVCGRGNNGGDGFVIARQLILKSIDVALVVLGGSDLKGDALINYKMVKNMCQIQSDLDHVDFNVDIIVDAIFGTGLDRDIKGDYKKAVEMINESKAKVYAVDIPSGVNGSNGHIMGTAVKADVTVSFEAYKIGHMIYPGAGYCGMLKLAPIGIPKASYDPFDFDTFEITEQIAKRLMPLRKQNSHKGTFGKASVIAGSKGMEGAAVLLCSAAMRTGLGLLNLLMIEDINWIVKPLIPEILTSDYKLEDTLSSDVLAIGSGSGQSYVFENVLKEVLLLDKKVVVDADGLNIVSRHLDWLRPGLVLTPHIKEMSRLSGLSVDEILKDPIGTARSFACKHKIVLVMKSARTIVALPSGKVYINTRGNAGMAVGGMGDLLTGIITALIGQGLSLEDASILGVYLHASAGDRVKDKIGEYGLLPSDLLKELAILMKKLTSE